ncbi:MAG: CheR family methyltransferase [Candidatus Zixiibacteriota bacterium]
MAMTAHDFDTIRGLVKQASGLVIGPEHREIVEARLSSLAERRGITSVAGLISALRDNDDDPLRPRAVRAIASVSPVLGFDSPSCSLLVGILFPDLLERRRERAALRIWCADCGCGQNPHGIAVLMREHFPFTAAWKITILATDRSAAHLERMRSGSFSRADIDHVPPELLARHFRPMGMEWQIDGDLGRQVEFRTLGLGDGPLPEGRFDLVILGDSLPYYDRARQQEIVSRLRALLEPDGYLLLGSEAKPADLGTWGGWDSCHAPGCYRPATMDAPVLRTETGF